MMREDGYIIYSLPEDPNVVYTKEVRGIEHFYLDLQIYVNDIESFPSVFYYVNKTGKWLVPFKTGNGEYDFEWKEFEGKIIAFKYSTYLT